MTMRVVVPIDPGRNIRLIYSLLVLNIKINVTSFNLNWKIDHSYLTLDSWEARSELRNEFGLSHHSRDLEPAQMTTNPSLSGHGLK